MRTPENIVKGECKSFLRAIGAVVLAPVQTGFGGDALDLIACWRGHYIEVECKRRSGGRLTRRQERRIACIEAAGGLACCVTSGHALLIALECRFGAIG